MGFEDTLPQRDPIERFRSAFWASVRPPLRRLTLVGALTSIIMAALISRIGTPWSRFSALAIVVLTTAWLVALHVNKSLHSRDPRRVLTQIVLPSDPEGGRRALRAMQLHENSLRDDSFGSSALAEQYLSRSLSSISIQKIESRGRRRAMFLETLVFIGLLGSALLAVAKGHRILEGCNVALSRNGKAPFAMLWLDVDSVTALPPAYLRISEHSLLFGSRVSEPKGTSIWIRGLPTHPNVPMVLTNGKQFVNFVGGTDGAMTARWTLETSERLRVAARLGQVVVEQGDEIIVDAEVDLPPVVELENANRTIRLDQVERVELIYRASDDHGLRQIDLVMKSADREERRQLIRLDGQQTEYQGSHAVPVADPFLRNAQLPVMVRIEARDDNSLVENIWGHSEWLKLEPPSPGENEVSRLKALDSIRAELLDWLAHEITRDRAQPNSSLADTQFGRHATDVIGRALTEVPGAWEWPRPVELLLRAQKEKLEKSLLNPANSILAVEHAALTVDAAFHALAERDAKLVARSLAELADEVVQGARQANASEKRVAATRRIDAATSLLASGGRQMASLGSLGADLSGIVRATITRMSNARKVEDFTHVQLAAEYLASRLRRPMPSAGGAQTSSVESGKSGQELSSRSRSTASDADVRIERLLWELQQLKEEHKAGLELLERALKGAADTAELEEDRSLAKQRADRLRGLAEHLPYLGAEPDSALSSQVVAREQALGMAEAVERLSYDDALTRGRTARDAVNEAMIRASRETNRGNVDEKTLRQLRDELDGQSQYLYQALQRAKQKATRAAAGELHDQVGRERQLAKRAHALATREKRNDAVLPESMRRDLDRASSLMDDASESLSVSDGDLALHQEQKAQALLDQFDEKLNHSSSGRNGDDPVHGKGSPSTDKGTVTPTGDPQAAAAFRRRVQRGLSQDLPGDLGSTIRRYAEGLLR